MSAQTALPPELPKVPILFGWWPSSRIGRIFQILVLLSVFFQTEGGFFYRSYFTVVTFSLLTALRYGWQRFARHTQFEAPRPRWKSPGLLAVGFCAFHFIVILPATNSEGATLKPKMVEAKLDAEKQQWFGRFHPVGKAKSVKLHEVRTEKTPQGKRTIARFTLYWEGPLTKDGFTKIVAVYDSESERWVRAEILETNGTTKTQVLEGVGAFVEGYIQAQ